MERDLGILVLMVDAVPGVSGAACHLPELDAVLINRREVPGRRHYDLALSNRCTARARERYD